MAKRGCRLGFVVLLVMALCASQLFADSVPVSWVDASGNWSTASNWNPAVVPNNSGGTTYAVSASGPLGAPSTFIGVDISPTVDSLSLGPGVQVGVGSGSTLTTGTLSTSGFVRSPPTSGSVFRLAPGATLNANGFGLFGDSAGVFLDGIANIGSLDVQRCGGCPSFEVGGLVNAGSFNGGGVSVSAGGTLNIASQNITIGPTAPLLSLIDGTVTVGTGNLLPLSSSAALVNAGSISNFGSGGVGQSGGVAVGTPPPGPLPGIPYLGFSVGSNGTYDEVISSSASFGTLTGGTGGISLDGTLEITLRNGFIPAVGQRFAIISTCVPQSFGCVPVSAISGTFANIEGQTFNNGTEMWDVVYSPSEVDLVVAPVQNVVPEPSLFILAGLGLAAIVLKSAKPKISLARSL